MIEECFDHLNFASIYFSLLWHGKKQKHKKKGTSQSPTSLIQLLYKEGGDI